MSCEREMSTKDGHGDELTTPSPLHPRDIVPIPMHPIPNPHNIWFDSRLAACIVWQTYVPITVGIPQSLSPFPWYYRGCYPHPRGITATVIPITAVLPQSLSPCQSLMSTLPIIIIIIIIKNECHSNIIVDRLQGCSHSKKLRESESELCSSKVV